MAHEPGRVSRLHLRTLFSVGITAGLTDGQLLERFATHGGEAAELAFAAIVERHGPMVYRTCRSILRDEHEAMDAFQATFLVLLSKGGSLWVKDSLGPWLHRVAYRAAGRAKIAGTRRRVHERKAAEQESGRPFCDSSGDLAGALHEEVDRLPNHYRVPVVLCDLEGHTYEDAARHLGCPVGTVRSRLARGREQLRGRLIRRGLAPSAGLLGAAFASEVATAAMPVALMGSTIQIATRFLSGGATTTAVASTSVLELAKGVQTLILISKLKFISAGLVATVALTAIGAVVLVQRGSVDRRSETLQPRQARSLDLLTPSRVAGENRPWLKTMPNGGTIEVIGISPHPSGPNTWWNPDGSPLEQPPCAPSNSRLKATEDTIPRAVVVRLSNLPPDADPQLIRSRWWRNRSDIDADETAVQDGKTVPGLRIVVASFSKNQTTGTIWFEAATGPWQTVATFQEFTTKGDTSGGLSFMSGRATAMNNGGTALTVAHNIQETATQVVAVDRQGKEYLSHGIKGGVGANGFVLSTAEFDLNPENIQEYRLQKRHYEPFYFELALNPTQAK